MTAFDLSKQQNPVVLDAGAVSFIRERLSISTALFPLIDIPVNATIKIRTKIVQKQVGMKMMPGAQDRT